MSVMVNPRHTAVYDVKYDHIAISFRDGRDSSVIEIDPDALPSLINSLMSARKDAKDAKRAAPIPPPMIRPRTCPPPSRADARPVRLANGSHRR